MATVTRPSFRYAGPVPSGNTMHRLLRRVNCAQALVWTMAAAGLLIGGNANALSFGKRVVSYDPGTTAAAGLTNPDSAKRLPSGIVGEDAGFDNVLSPFNPGFEADELVSIGEGGHLTIQLRDFAVVGAGLELGVVANVGLADASFPTGQNFSPAFAFGLDSAVVEVSEDGQTFVALNGGAPILFDLPSIFWLNAGPFDTSKPAGAVGADFGLPFLGSGSLGTFDGLDYASTVAAFGGSGGGTWLDLSGTGLSQVAYVRFSVADDGNAGTSLNFELDAVVVSSAATGAAVPEPALGFGLAALAVVWLRSRRD